MSGTRRKTRKRSIPPAVAADGPLTTSYGVVTLPKGMRLYHTSYDPLCKIKRTKPVLFMTLHPSDWYNEDSHVSLIELQREVRLLFMVKTIRQFRIWSALTNFLGASGSNMNKQNSRRILEWLPYLEAEGLDGWFSSVESKSAVEFTIRSDPAILKVVECTPFQFGWKNAYFSRENIYIPKDWGSMYPISSRILPVKFLLHERFRPMIEEYQRRMKEEDPEGTTFAVLLENADIQYFDGVLEDVRW